MDAQETCDKCNESFGSGHQLRTHIETVHHSIVSEVTNGKRNEVAVNNQTNDVADGMAKMTVVEKRDLDLNILKHLENKLKWIKRDGIYYEGGSVTGISARLCLKTSLYEYLRTNFGQEMAAKYGIEVDCEKVITANSIFGDAQIEYQLKAKFMSGTKAHMVKITFYSTTCAIFIQCMGEKSQSLDHLGQMTQAQFFASKILELGEEILANNAKIEECIPKLKANLIKLKAIVQKQSQKKVGSKTVQKQKINQKLICNGSTTKGEPCKKLCVSEDAFVRCMMCEGAKHYMCFRPTLEEKEKFKNGKRFVCSK